MKPYTLTNREGETISPMTSTRTVFDERGTDLDTLLSQQRQDADNALKDYAKKTEVTQGLAGKQNKLTPTTDLHITDDNIIGLTEEFKDRKLDKAVWDEKNQQFGLFGILRNTGYQYVASWVVTPFMIIDKNSDISYDIIMDSINHIYIQFYDVNFNIIESLWNDGTTTHITGVIEKNDIPSSAVYYRATGLTGHTHKVSNGLTFESREGAVSEAIAASKLALFIDMWNEACGAYGKYDPANTPDPEHPFYLNELWLTYEEAIGIYEACVGINTIGTSKDSCFSPYLYRTAMPIHRRGIVSAANFFNESPNLETVSFYDPTNIPFMVSRWDGMFSRCPKLHTIIGSISVDKAAIFGEFYNCKALKEVRLKGINKSFSIRYSPKLSLASVSYMITNASNAAPITFTVHPDVYAKLTGDTTNPTASALTQEELAQWQQLLVDAAEKQITFATT